MSSAQKFLILLKKFYINSKTDFDDFDMEVYESGISPIGFDRGLQALMKIAQESGFHKIPTVKQILEKCGHKEPDEDDKANFVVGRIIEASGSIGSYREDAAKEFIGPLGWEVVKKFGKWSDLCMVTTDQLPTVRAQLRQFAKAVNAYDSIGALNEKPQLSEGNFMSEVLQEVGKSIVTLKTVGEKK